MIYRAFNIHSISISSTTTDCAYGSLRIRAHLNTSQQTASQNYSGSVSFGTRSRRIFAHYSSAISSTSRRPATTRFPDLLVQRCAAPARRTFFSSTVSTLALAMKEQSMFSCCVMIRLTTAVSLLARASLLSMQLGRLSTGALCMTYQTD